MNVEMIAALEEIKSTLARACEVTDRQLRNPFSEPIDLSGYLLTKIHVVTKYIDDKIKAEEDAFEAYYQEQPTNEDEPSLGFSPLIDACADKISKAMGNCWVMVRASRQNGEKPEYTISIQPDNHNTPTDIQLVLKSLGYAPTFKSIRELESSTWVDFEVEANGIAFFLSSTVSSIEPPELDRFSEPATDDELPF